MEFTEKLGIPSSRDPIPQIEDSLCRLKLKASQYVKERFVANGRFNGEMKHTVMREGVDTYVTVEVIDYGLPHYNGS